MSNRFSDLIRRLEIEVTNLKTAHEHGLGAVEFYSKSASGQGTPSSSYLTATITATVASGELLPAFAQIQVQATGNQEILQYSHSQSGNTIVWTYNIHATASPATINATVISSAKLSNLTVSA